MTLPARLDRKSHRENAGKRSPGHRAFVRRHACSACGSVTGIECAHVRNGTGGGISMKPSDRWCLSLCRDCHALQHRIGETSFEKRFGLPGWMKAKCDEFAKASKHWPKLREMP